MIKKSVFEDEIITGMHQQLIKQSKGIEVNNLSQAVDYLNSAAQIFEDLGMVKNADYVLLILSKLGEGHTHDKPGDHHTKGLTPDKMVENLKHHGIVFNLTDNNSADQEIEDTLEVSDHSIELHDFEDEMTDDQNHAKSHSRDTRIIELDKKLAELYSKEGHSDAFERLLQEQEKLINEALQGKK